MNKSRIDLHLYFIFKVDFYRNNDFHINAQVGGNPHTQSVSTF